MFEHLLVAATLTGVLYVLLDSEGERVSKPWGAARLTLLGMLSWLALDWTRNVRLFPDAFPIELPPFRALALLLGSVALGAAAFSAGRGLGVGCGGRRGLLSGAAFGLLSSATGLCASRWPQISRAVELCGGVFVALALATSLTLALAATHAAVAAALLRDENRLRLRVILAAVALWALATFGAQTVLARIWGFGPRTLALAADVPSNEDAQRLAVAWLYPTGRHSYHIDGRRMSSQTTDLSLESIDRLESFLERSRFRGIFTGEALAAVRLGHLQWWQEERALDALMILVPGRAHPDYRRALDLIRAGPLSAERFGKLSQLSASTGRRVEGFETASDTQFIFEGFSAAYARFGDEVKAREWLGRLDGLWAVGEKRIEVGSLEDLRSGHVTGAAFLDERPARSLRVGLFLVSRSSATQTTHYWLSGARRPDEDGRFSFDSLGPGRYALALLGRPEDLRGTYLGAPGYFEVTDEHPDVNLKAICIVSVDRPRMRPCPTS